MGALLEIAEIKLGSGAEGLAGGHLDVPKQGMLLEAGALDLVGWALGDEVPVVAVELLRDRRVFRRLTLGVARPDVADAFPDIEGAGEAGFRGSLNLLGQEPELSLELRAVLAEQRRVPFASLRARRRWRESAGPERELVSVVIPCFDQAHFVGEAIDSALAQTYPHVELIVVDDGSHDNTAAVAARYPGVKYVRQENQGLAAARNTGIRHTNGDFLVFLDADDRLLPHAVESGLAHMRAHPEAAFVSGHYRWIGPDGSPLPSPVQERVERDHYLALLRHNIAGMPGTVLYRRAVFEHVNGFDSSVDACADYDLYLRIARDFPVVCHGEAIGLYRQHGNSMSRDRKQMLRCTISVLRAQRPYLRRDPALRKGYAEGETFWREYYGEPTGNRFRVALADRNWRGDGRKALLLPFDSVLTAARRQRPKR